MRSGLVAQETLDEALALLEPLPGEDLADGQVAAKLVEMGCLNQWQAEQLLVGRTKFTLKDYHIIDSIGQGGMGQVFKAEHPIMGRIVAIKVLPHDKCTPEAINSFMREIRAQAQLDHENLVRAFDAGREGVVHYLVTEFVPGADLRRCVRKNGPLTMAQAATVISQAARGLLHAHQRGLIHRDVKPGNLLVTPEGRTKVSDLGLVASLFGDDDPRAGKVVGTADYLSPEQILTPHTITPVSDVYSLGCTLYYAVTAKVPFPGGTTRDKVRRHIDLEAIPLNPRRFNASLADEFIEVIAAMMEKDARRRLQTMDEVILQLAPWAVERVEGSMTAPTAEPPLSFIPTPKAEPPLLKDTEPAFVDVGYHDPWYQDSPSQTSQTSQGTDPFASADYETMPQFSRRRIPMPAERLFSKPLTILMSIAIALMAALLAAILFSLYYRP
ncbi:MAG TPA: serine/threonine-protein kinase [Pirellulales bacterium]|nr:serine/threonine-protein kinase [Pirellulales bacterium]